MKPFRHLWIVATLTVVMIIGGMSLHFYLTDGFSLEGIKANFSVRSQWEARPPTPEEEALASQILDQPFSYLGKGCQSYVFLSEDEEYVIKFFRYDRLRARNWMRSFTFIPPLKRYYEKKVKENERKIELAFVGYSLAFDIIQDTTQIAYLHLNKTQHLNKSLTVYDKLGIKHIVDLDEVEFLIQKKATMLPAAFKAIIKAGDLEQGKALLSSLVSMIVSEYQRGIIDEDYAILRNMGVVDGMPIHIDAGQAAKNEQAEEPTICKARLERQLKDLRKWLVPISPELTSYLDGLATAADL